MARGCRTTSTRCLTGGAGANDYTQTALGRGRRVLARPLLVRSEMVLSRWRAAARGDRAGGVDLDALAVWVEGRYKLTPRIFVAARVDHLGFSECSRHAGAAAVGRARHPRRGGGGYSLQRNLTARVGVQQQRPRRRARPRAHLLAAQLVFWF